MGAFGVLYNRCIALSQDFFAMLKPAWIKAVLPFAAIVLLAVFYPRVLGSGHDLVSFAGEGGAGVKVLLILLVIKFIFSIFSFGTGAPGGIFLPLLVLGAVTGGLFTEVVSPLVGYANTYSAYFVILGMAGYFAAIVRAPITGIILISEMTGIFSNLLPLAIVSLVAHITAEILGGVPIYDQLLDSLLAGRSSAGKRATRRPGTDGCCRRLHCRRCKNMSWSADVLQQSSLIIINKMKRAAAGIETAALLLSARVIKAWIV